MNGSEKSVADQESPAPRLRRLPYTVRLSPALVNDLLRNRMSTAGEAQVSGLLFGAIEEGLALVQAYVQFDPAVVAGGAESRSEQDKLLEHVLANAAQSPPTATLSLLGWYAIRAEGGMLSSDLDYHDWYFPRPQDIALLIRPEGLVDATLELYCRTVSGQLSNEGHRIGLIRLSSNPLEAPVEIMPRPKIQDDFFMRAYQVDDAQDKSKGWKEALGERYRKTFPPRPAAEPEPEPQGRVQPPLPPSALSRNESSAVSAPVATPLPQLRRVLDKGKPASRNSVWPLAFVSFLLASVATFAVVYYLRKVDRLPTLGQLFGNQSRLQLKVEQQGERLLLSWDRNNQSVRNARDGSLRIDDGAQRRDVALDARQISTGAILYRPKSDDVTFQLLVQDMDGHNLEETLKVLDSGKPSIIDLSPQEVTGSSTGKPVPEVITPKRTPAVSTSAITRSKPVTNLSAPASAAKTSRRPEKPVQHGNRTGQNAVASDAQPTPAKTEADASKEEVLATPGDLDNNQAVQAQPGVTAGENGTRAQVPPPGALTAQGNLATYVPPRPLRQVLPNISLLAPGVAAQAGQMEVLVRVDDTGRVTDAQVVSTGTKPNQLLMQSALTAARQWKFQPATMRGRAVSSQHSIVFQFSPRP